MLHGNYLIAGSTGLMGTTALLRLKDQPGVNVKAVYHKRKPHVFADNIEYVQANLKNPEDCKQLVKDVDYVLMFAAILSTAPMVAKNPVSHVTDTMIMNAQMLEAAYFEKVKKFVWLSSSTGYPMIDGAITENDMFKGDPPTNYFSVGWMSRYTEILCRMYSTKLNNPLKTVILRPSTIYGEYESFDFEKSHVLPALIRRVVERQKPLVVWGTDEKTRDLIYSDDVFDACLLALEKVDDFDVFNIGFGEEYSINQLLKTIIKLDNFKDAEIVYDKTKPTSISKRSIDFSKAEKILGFKPKTSIEDGISKMINYYRKNPFMEEKNKRKTLIHNFYT